jgi:hypothetical protein
MRVLAQTASEHKKHKTELAYIGRAPLECRAGWLIPPLGGGGVGALPRGGGVGGGTADFENRGVPPRFLELEWGVRR